MRRSLREMDVTSAKMERIQALWRMVRLKVHMIRFISRSMRPSRQKTRISAIRYIKDGLDKFFNGLVLKPDTNAIFVWDIIALHIIAFALWCDILNIAFNFSIHFYYAGMFLFFDFLIFIDIFLGFVTSFNLPSVESKYERRFFHVIWHNLKKRSFLELIGTVPSLVTLEHLPYLCFSKLLRIHRYFSFSKTKTRVKKLAAQNLHRNCRSITLKLLNAYFFIINITLVVQLLASLILSIATNEYDNSWLQDQNIPLHDTESAYIAAIYFIVTTISTLGYGDITAKSFTEYIIMIFIQMIGVGFYPIMINQMRSIYEIRVAHIDDLVN